MSTATRPSTTEQVRTQYEWLPYPDRRPDDERKRLVMTGLDEVAAVSHHCFGGRWQLHGGLRILVAGGGTGDSLVYLAHQLRRTDASFVYVDLSEASLKIAQQRMAVRGLKSRVQWVHGSLLDLPRYGVGTFDYINCSGVLHHLSDPAEGLAALHEVLSPGGVMGLMVYGQIGRTAVYQMQQLGRLLTANEPDKSRRLDLVTRLLPSLPPSNWYSRGGDLFQSSAEMSPAEMYDLFLHSQDRAYTVPELYDWLDGAGLHFANYTLDNRLWYDPDLAFQDPVLREEIGRLPRRQQEEACELFWGLITKHSFWATAQPPVRAAWDDLGMVPVFSHLAEVSDVRRSFLETTGKTWSIDFSRGSGPSLQVTLNVDPVSRRFFELVDGRRTVAEIGARLHETFPEKSAAHLVAECGEVFRLLQPYDLILLRHASIAPLGF